MEGIKELAIAYHERATEEEKETAREYFKRLDQNGDGKVSLLEFKKSVSSWLYSDKVFKQLDANGEGTLDFNEVLAIYYMEKEKLSLYCRDCRDLLLGQFFSCFLCLPKYPNSVDLCCDCYRKGEFEHEHSISNFIDHNSLLKRLMNRLGNEEKREMEELHEIARSHYLAGSQQVQAKAHDFFNSMDSDGDVQIDLREFLAFVSQKDHCRRMDNREFFKELDRDGNGKLDFWEVMTLYYIIKSGRPFCGSCAKFVPGIFFSCVGVGCSFTLCHNCYRSKNFNHHHNGRTQFLDNYTLLQAKQDSSQATQINPYMTTDSSYYVHHPNTSPSAFSSYYVHHPNPSPSAYSVHHPNPSPSAYSVHHPNPSPSAYSVHHPNPSPSAYSVHHPNPSPSASTAIVPAYKMNKWDVALKAFEVALAIGNIASTACTIL